MEGSCLEAPTIFLSSGESEHIGKSSLSPSCFNSLFNLCFNQVKNGDIIHYFTSVQNMNPRNSV